VGNYIDTDSPVFGHGSFCGYTASILMKLNITSLRGTEYEGDIVSLNIQTAAGEVTILDHHRPLVTVLARGTAKILGTDDKETIIQVESGFMEVSPDNIINILMG